MKKVGFCLHSPKLLSFQVLFIPFCGFLFLQPEKTLSAFCVAQNYQKLLSFFFTIYRFLVDILLLINYFEDFMPLFWASIFSDKKWAIILIIVSMHYCIFLPLAAVFFSLSLIFSSLTFIFLAWLSLYLPYLGFTELLGLFLAWCFLTNLGNFWLLFLKIYFCSVLHLLSHWGSNYICVICNLMCYLILFHKLLCLCTFIKNLFSFFALVWIISIDLCFVRMSLFEFYP